MTAPKLLWFSFLCHKRFFWFSVNFLPTDTVICTTLELQRLKEWREFPTKNIISKCQDKKDHEVGHRYQQESISLVHTNCPLYSLLGDLAIRFYLSLLVAGTGISVQFWGDINPDWTVTLCTLCLLSRKVHNTISMVDKKTNSLIQEKTPSWIKCRQINIIIIWETCHCWCCKCILNDRIYTCYFLFYSCTF